MKHTLLLFFLVITIQTFSQSKNQSIGFKENKGQIIDQKGKPNIAVKYLLNSNGLNVQLKKNGFSYDVYEVKKTPSKNPRNERELSSNLPKNQKEEQPDFNLEYTFHRIDIDFLNSNSKVEFITDQKSNDFDNYYNVPNKPEGITGVHQYKQITYKNIYPNVDVVFSIPKDPQKTVEYNFVVHPKGKISDIQLKFSGAETDLFDNKIQMKVRFGKMEETLPASWIEDGSSKKEIAVGYRKIKKDVYGFDSAHSVDGKTIVIDPVPTRLWGTYYGGENIESSTAITTKDGFVYLAGITYSDNNIASSGAYQTTNLSTWDYDAFFAKFNSDGTRVWGTFFGGTHADLINKIKLSSLNNIYIAGTTLSRTNISTVGSHQSNPGSTQWNSYDGFLAKFNNNGILQWATYYGEEGYDIINGLTINTDESIFVSGETKSDKNIATENSFQPLLIISPLPSGSASSDAFIAKFDSSGVRQWGTYIGGNGDDLITDSQLDSNGNIYFLGITDSNNNISTPLSYQQSISSSQMDGFLVKFDVDGNRIFGTYIGGNKLDYFHNLGIDYENNLYCFGETESDLNISTTGVFQENFTENTLRRSGCIFKLNPDGRKIWGSYFFPEVLGGSVKANGTIYFTGRAENGFQSTIDSYQEFKNTGTDSYLVKFNTNGQREWATYVGGEMADNALLTEVENNSNIYLAGTTQSKTNIATLNTFQPNLYPDTNSYTFNTGDAFLIKFQECLSNPSASSNSPVCTGRTLELKASGGTNYSWTGPNGFTSTDQNPTIINATTLNSGEYNCLITGTSGCDDTKKVNVVIGDIEGPIPDVASLSPITGDCHTTITVIPTATDACAGAITGSTSNPLSYSLPGTYTIVWKYDDGNGNISQQNQTVTITGQPLPTASTPQAFCIQQNATLDDIEIMGQSIKWYNAQSTGTLLPNTTLLQNGITYYASQTINGCESERTPVTINIQNTLPPTGSADQPFCSAQNPTIANLDVTGNSIKWYDALNGSSLLPETTSLVDGKTYYASQTVNTCESPRFGITVSIVNTPAAPTLSGKTEFCKTENATLDNIQITGQNLKWYDTSFSAAVLPNTTLLEDNKTYYVSQTVGCESDRTPILVRVYDTALPTGSTSKQFCIDENATLASIGIIGTNIKWYDSAINGSNLLEATLLQNATYYVSQTLNSCESERFAIKVEIQDTQNPIADSPQRFCIQKNALISDIDIKGENINWFENASSYISLSASTPLENGITYYASQTINSCESDRIPITIQILEATNGDCINFVDELPYSKFFTPNGDTFHDTWTIDFAYLAPNTSIRIFDRYGKFIKELHKDMAWDGTYLGTQEPTADYWFTVTRLNGTEFRGHFSLKR